MRRRHLALPLKRQETSLALPLKTGGVVGIALKDTVVGRCRPLGRLIVISSGPSTACQTQCRYRTQMESTNWPRNGISAPANKIAAYIKNQAEDHTVEPCIEHRQRPIHIRLFHDPGKAQQCETHLRRCRCREAAHASGVSDANEVERLPPAILQAARRALITRGAADRLPVEHEA